MGIVEDVTLDAEAGGGDCLFCFKESGSWYGALELTYGPVAVKRVASAAERDILCAMTLTNNCRVSRTIGLRLLFIVDSSRRRWQVWNLWMDEMRSVGPPGNF